MLKKILKHYENILTTIINGLKHILIIKRKIKMTATPILIEFKMAIGLFASFLVTNVILISSAVLVIRLYVSPLKKEFIERIEKAQEDTKLLSDEHLKMVRENNKEAMQRFTDFHGKQYEVLEKNINDRMEKTETFIHDSLDSINERLAKIERHIYTDYNISQMDKSLRNCESEIKRIQIIMAKDLGIDFSRHEN